MNFGQYPGGRGAGRGDGAPPVRSTRWDQEGIPAVKPVTEADVRGIVEKAVENTVSRKLDETTARLEGNSARLMQQVMGQISQLLPVSQPSLTLAAADVVGGSGTRNPVATNPVPAPLPPHLESSEEKIARLENELRAVRAEGKRPVVPSENERSPVVERGAGATGGNPADGRGPPPAGSDGSGLDPPRRSPASAADTDGESPFDVKFPISNDRSGEASENRSAVEIRAATRSTAAARMRGCANREACWKRGGPYRTGAVRLIRLVYCPVGGRREEKRRRLGSDQPSIYLNSETVADGLNSFSLGGGSASRAAGVRLVDWDSMATLQKDQPGYPGLTAHSERNLVQDMLKEVEDLTRHFVDQSAIGAANSFGAIQRKTQVKTAKPPGEILGYVQLVEKVEALKSYMNDSQTCDEWSKRELASERSLPISVFKQAFAIIDKGLEYTCAFDDGASILLTGYQQLLEQHRRGLRRYADSSPDKMSGTAMVASLTDMCRTFQTIASYCVREGYNRGVAAQKVSASSSSTEKELQDMIKTAQAYLVGISSAAKPSQHNQKTAKVKSEHEDAALAHFKHNSNGSQEDAASQEKVALGHLRKLQNMPESASIRKQTLSKGLCQFHWDPATSCNRARCRFAHLSQRETADLGITDEEIRSALGIRP